MTNKDNRLKPLKSQTGSQKSTSKRPSFGNEHYSESANCVKTPKTPKPPEN